MLNELGLFNILGMPRSMDYVWFKVGETYIDGDYGYFWRCWYDSDGLVRLDEGHYAGTWPIYNEHRWIDG